MIRLPIFVIAMLALPIAANAQLSNDMTCDEAIAHFEKNRSIETSQDGNVMPISEGTPIKEATLLTCDQGGSRFDTMVPTKDKRQCVIAAYCE